MTERNSADIPESRERVTGPVHDQISAFLDDELSDEEAAFLVRRFERDPETRKQAVRYATIGLALRGELLGPDPNLLRRRIDAALSGATPQPFRVPPSRTWPSRIVRPLVGGGIAAAVALAGVVALRSNNDSRPDTAVAVGRASNAAVAVQAWTEPPSYVVPQDILESGPVTPPPPIRLTNYLMHHGQYASRLSRTSVNSNVVGGADLPPETESLVQPALNLE